MRPRSFALLVAFSLAVPLTVSLLRRRPRRPRAIQARPGDLLVVSDSGRVNVSVVDPFRYPDSADWWAPWER